MPVLRLPDASTKDVAPGTTARQVAEGIGKRLALAAVAAKVDGEIVDLDRELPNEGEHSFQILTERDAEALDVLRHSSAHIMARAVMRLFPGVQLAFGPVTEGGFYYDIESPTPIREEDFPRIEAEMKAIVQKAEPFERFERPVAEAVQLCDDLKQALKVEHIRELAKENATVSFYRQGEFIDLCRGPHIPHAGKVGAFKLLSIAGAYWKNDATKAQLQRLYATAFFNPKDLEEHLRKIEEAKKRDHRVLGRQLKLFTISPMVGSGLILWMPKGAIVRGLLETFIKDELIKRGYSPVYTPHIGRLELYRVSGHFPYYRDAQFPPIYARPAAGALDLCQYRLSMGEIDEKREVEFVEYMKQNSFLPPQYLKLDSQAEKLEAVHQFALTLIDTMQVALPEYRKAASVKERADVLGKWLMEQEGYLLKPMNCPHHIHIYKAEPHSYRDLPVRLAEFGTVYRYEQTGELGGMTRVRGFTQDDAHLFVTAEQVEAELRSEIELALFVLRTLNLNEYRVRVSVRDPQSSKYVGPPELWDKAEQTLLDIVKPSGLNYSIGVGEAAFYGPKIDFIVKDCIGREWQLGTVQLDYNLPVRFGLEYVGADNATHRPIMIHRAPFGSMERFMGILIEHFAGAFPTWLAPEQVRVLTVSDKTIPYARTVEQQLREASFRVTGDYRPDKIGSKIREAQLEKTPYMLVIGEKEATSGTVAVRARVEGDQGAVPIAEFAARLQAEVAARK